MATFTIVANTNIDALTSKAGDDTYNINGNYTLTIDQDTRGGVNNDTSSIMGSVSPSATLGGNVTIDARYVRLIPYNTGTGNVPAWNTTISQGGASGQLIAVYSALNVASTATGAAMPASGYIKIKAWNETAYAAGALTGIGANATGADTVGWIEVVGTENPRNWTFNRLNNGSTPFSQGDWLEIGTTDGNRATTYQIPSNGVNQYHGGVFVQKQASATVTAASYSAGVVTFTASSHGFATGDEVVIQGVIPNTYNRLMTTNEITVTGANTFTMAYQSDPGTYTSGGTAYPIEGYPASSDTFVSTNTSTTAIKGKFCNISTAGLVRFGHDGTNSTGGYIVPTGMKVFMPNIFLTGATSAAKTQNSYNATTAQRPRFITSSGGRLDIRNVSMNFGLGSISAAQLFNFTNCIYNDSIIVTNPGSQLIWTNVVNGNQSNITGNRFAGTVVLTGADFRDVYIGQSGQGATANVTVSTWTDCTDLNFTRVKSIIASPRQNTTLTSITFSRVSDVVMADCTIGGAIILGSSTSNVEITNLTYFDQNGGVNFVPNSEYMIGVSTQCINWVIDGVSIADGDLPRSGLLNPGSSSADITMRNIGTRTAPLGMGLYEEDGASWSRVTTTATVTTASPHQLTTGDIIEVYRSDVTAAITRGNFTVTVTGANTFTFTCTNSGATSGVLSYYPVGMSRLYLQTNAINVKIQNVHVKNIRTGILSTDNSNFTQYHQNVSANWQGSVSVAYNLNNGHYNGSVMPPINPTATTATYGTHLLTGYTAEIGIPNGTTVPWTRVTTIATVTKSDHGMVTGQKIMVTASDNQAAIPTTATSQVTVLTKDTFTFTCTNSGTTSGNLSYKAADGLMILYMNETNADSASQVTLGGAAAFTGAGGLALFNVNDYATYETDKWILDFDSAANMLPFMSGGTLTDFDIAYDINTGSGYSGSFKNAYYKRAGGGGTSGLTTVTMTSTTGVNNGDYVYGVGIAEGAKVQSVTNSTDIVVDIANTATVSGTLVFSQWPNITALPTTGFKMKVKITCSTANTAAVTYLRLFFLSTATTRDNLYPQEVLPTQTVTVTGATAGSRIQLYDLTSSTELYNGTPTFPYTWTDTEEYAADREIRLRVSYVSGVTAKEYISTTIGTATEASPDLTYLVTQTDDTVYNTNAVNGSTTTGITISATRYSLTVSRTCAQIYAFAMYTAFTETGIRDYGLAMTAVDTANYLMDEVLLKNTSSGPAIAISVTGGWIRDFDTGVALDLVDTTGGTLFMAPDHVVAYGSTLTEADLNDIRLTNVLVKDGLS